MHVLATESAGRVILPSIKCSPGAYRQLGPRPLIATYSAVTDSRRALCGPCGSSVDNRSLYGQVDWIVPA